MINVVSLHKRFDKETVVNGVNLSINKGSIYGLLGSNGAGKTTLLKAMAGIIRPNKGKVTFEDQPIFENHILKESVIFIPDQPFFFQHYSIKQMAEFYREQYPLFNMSRFNQLEKVFKLDLKKKVHTFSKGMQRQVTFWLALSAMPDYLILDEPFDGLDAVVRKKIKQLIMNDVAEREMTVVISSHNLREVEDLCDQIGILHRGDFVMNHDIDDLRTTMHKVQLAYHQTPDLLFDQFEVCHHEVRGTVHLFIVKGNEEEIQSYIKTTQPIISDFLSLTLEEIFVYEMEGIGYAMENILV